MYNKLFTKILDSTIWLESDATRLVWITFIAIMDEDGFVALSSIGNVAARARVSREDAEAAIRILEAPDANDPGQEHEGRRIERVPSGWIVLNACKYREMVQRAEIKAANRRRVAKHRALKSKETAGNADVTVRNVSVMQSDTDTEAVSDTDKVKGVARKRASPLPEQFSISDRVKAWASKEGFDPDLHLAYFTSYAKANGKKYVDWDEAFMNAIRADWGDVRKKIGARNTVTMPSRPSITCSSCGQKAFTWTGGQCDPCWRKAQGFRPREAA